MNETELLELNRQKRREAGERISVYSTSKPQRKSGMTMTDIRRIIRESSGPALQEAIAEAVKENLNPETLREKLKEIARLELLRLRGKVV